MKIDIPLITDKPDKPGNTTRTTINDTMDSKANRELLGRGTFKSACHDGVPCFTRCCHNADMYLYPYDIVRMKQNLNMTSKEFLVAHTTTAIRDMPTFPNVMLKMSDRQGNPFIGIQGEVYFPDTVKPLPDCQGLESAIKKICLAF